MSRLVSCIALMLATTSPAYAKDAFTGTWKGDIKESELSKKPSIALIDNGFYTCSTCVPVVKIAADGALHPVTGHAYYDAMSVTVVDPATVKYATSKDGKPMSDATATLSADNSSISTVFNDTSAPNGIPVTGTTISERVAAGPTGSHAASGSWLQTNQTQVSDSGLVFTFAKTGKVVTYSTPTGTSYVATTGGPSVAVVGDAGWTTVSLRQSDLNTLHETDYLDGKVIGKYIMTISPDGKKMTMDVNDIKFGRTSTLIAYRQ